jgi:hypothetical protein
VDAYRGALRKEGINSKTVLFSAPTKKFNRHGKVNERALVITSDHIIKMDMAKKFKVALTLPLADVTQVSLSPDAGNQLVVIHLRGSNDLVMSMNSGKSEDLSGELVGVLAASYEKRMGRNLEIVTSNVLRARSGKNIKPITVLGLAGPNATFVRNKDGSVVYGTSQG